MDWWRLVEFEAEDVERLVALAHQTVHVIPGSRPMVVRVTVTGRLVPEVRIEHARTHPPRKQNKTESCDRVLEFFHEFWCN